MLLMCLSILACGAAYKAWEVYMMSVKPEDYLRLFRGEAPPAD